MTSSPVALLCCLAIPVVVLLAYIYWAKMTRRTLPHWRNALGLLSMLVLCSWWLLHTLMWIFYSVGVEGSTSKVARNAVDLGLYFIPVGMASTFFLRGFPRNLMIAAWLLMSVFLGHFYIA